MERFAAEIRARGLALGLTQAELARRSSVSERAMQHYLSARSEPNLAALVRICETLGCTPNDVLGVSCHRTVGKPDVKLASELVALCQQLDETSQVLARDIIVSILLAQARVHR